MQQAANTVSTIWPQASPVMQVQVAMQLNGRKIASLWAGCTTPEGDVLQVSYEPGSLQARRLPAFESVLLDRSCSPQVHWCAGFESTDPKADVGWLLAYFRLAARTQARPGSPTEIATHRVVWTASQQSVTILPKRQLKRAYDTVAMRERADRRAHRAVLPWRMSLLNADRILHAARPTHWLAWSPLLVLEAARSAPLFDSSLLEPGLQAKLFVRQGEAEHFAWQSNVHAVKAGLAADWRVTGLQQDADTGAAAAVPERLYGTVRHMLDHAGYTDRVLRAV